MTIAIDDSGWGSLVGGVLIGACRVESPHTQHAFREIPVQFFQGEAFVKKVYQSKAIDCVMELMRALGVPYSERIEICRGYILEEARICLVGVGYEQAVATKIGDPLQTMVENEFNNRLRALGLDVRGERGLDWWKAVNWLKGGDVEAGAPDPERAKVCKTGWKSYPIWANNPYSVAKVLAKRAKKNRGGRFYR